MFVFKFKFREPDYKVGTVIKIYASNENEAFAFIKRAFGDFPWARSSDGKRSFITSGY